ncbi:Ig-like domain-containing protein [Aestuariicoccus sp. MJ-SS9]|uniref:Ig-like domain-containing protein n=1 Tax=Aestuariicoccus sp. MJ-SS9 TaxID=3079855 RepID=UPI0029154F7A|nr:Ig-like domain-containing protein [Aestuariicoccus sp. MJ-SS9]MDU8913745.1 Ig-like domain-containing protein [Aestuariicoccus sp. MJ-SS9]
MARSITFTIHGPVDTLIKIEELDGGALRFDIDVLGSGLIGDLRGVFFDLKELNSTSAGLTVLGVDGDEDLIGRSLFREERVDKVHRDVNIKGPVEKEQGAFDAGIEFGTPGIGKDDVSEVSFVLTANEPLSLDSLDLADFGLRYTSVGIEGDGREDSEKIAGDASGVARNDAWEVDENVQGTVDLLDNDTNGTQENGTRKTLISVVDDEGALVPVAGGFERVVIIDGLELGTLFVSDDGFATFTANGADVDKLAHDDIRTWEFTYETVSSVGNLASADALLTIDGQNDQPVAFDRVLSVGEDDAFDTVQSPQFGELNGDGVTGRFVGTDIDDGDVLSFEIISEPVDVYGNQYGQVVNNGDGTFTFNPTDEFQFLEAGETRDVTFQYVAIDDSGVGTSPVFPEETERSAPATVTITVEGADDADLSLADQLLFRTTDRSIWNSNEAFSLAPDIPFLGFTFNESLDATLWNGITLDSGVVLDVLNGFVDAGEVVLETACDIFTLGLADCDVDFGNIDNITIPGISTAGNAYAKVGLQPYFFLNAGEVDAEVPVDVVFTAPRQVEAGDTITIGSAYTIDGGATFQTSGPSVQFGIDFVLDIVADLTLNALGSSIELFDFDTGDFLETGVLGEPGFNIFDVGPGSTTEIELPLDSTLTLTVPDFGATGTPVNPDNSRLEGSDEEEFVDLTIDVDALISLIPGVPPFGGGDSFGLDFDFGELGNLDIASFSYGWDLLDIDLQGILSAVQDFSMSITDLPLLARLEDGVTEITGFSLGDDVTFDVPEDSSFDADVDGDADGLMDFDIEVDIEALFEHQSSLELDMNLILGLLRFTAGVTSDFISDDLEFSLFDGLVPSLPFDPDPDDGFLIGGTIPLIEDARLATLFDDEFPLEGWNTETNTTDLFFDVA